MRRLRLFELSMRWGRRKACVRPLPSAPPVAPDESDLEAQRGGPQVRWTSGDALRHVPIRSGFLFLRIFRNAHIDFLSTLVRFTFPLRNIEKVVITKTY